MPDRVNVVGGAVCAGEKRDMTNMSRWTGMLWTYKFGKRRNNMFGLSSPNLSGVCFACFDISLFSFIFDKNFRALEIKAPVESLLASLTFVSSSTSTLS